jgi:virginiamycin A acetyltransferase
MRYRIYRFFKRIISAMNFVDRNAELHKTCSIQNSEIHGKVRLGEKTKIYKTLISGDVTIGRYTTLWGPDIQVLSVIHPIQIGSFCSVARSVTIQEYFHDHGKLTTYYIGRNIFGEHVSKEVLSKGPVHIGNDVWIGTGVQIMSGVTIGDGAVIAANATVTGDIPPYAIAGGVPARVIGYRFDPPLIEELLKLQWWKWDIDKIMANKGIFLTKFGIESLPKIK